MCRKACHNYPRGFSRHARHRRILHGLGLYQGTSSDVPRSPQQLNPYAASAAIPASVGFARFWLCIRAPSSDVPQSLPHNDSRGFSRHSQRSRFGRDLQGLVTSITSLPDAIQAKFPDHVHSHPALRSCQHQLNSAHLFRDLIDFGETKPIAIRSLRKTVHRRAVPLSLPTHISSACFCRGARPFSRSHYAWFRHQY
jgi:hypothetical protein